MATRNPHSGPEIPISSNAFLFGIGSLVEINAPKVPRRNGGGRGMK
jgi:hypothetical protein